MNEDQQRFLEQLAMRIPRLFDAIRQGNVKSEYIVGIRRIGTRHVRLKLVAEVVDAGANPLESHSRLRSVVVRAEIDEVGPAPEASSRESHPWQAQREEQRLKSDPTEPASKTAPRNRKSRKAGKPLLRP